MGDFCYNISMKEHSPKQNQPTKSRKPLIIALIVMAILLIATIVVAILAITGHWFDTNPQPETTTQQSPSEENAKPEERPLSDKKIKQDINYKIATLHSYEDYSTDGSTTPKFTDDYFERGTGYSYINDLYRTGLSDTQKLSIALYSIRDQFKRIGSDTKKADDYTRVIRQYNQRNKTSFSTDYIEYTGYIDIDPVARQYNNLFGANPTHQDAMEDSFCGAGFFFNSAGVYYSAPAGCGGVDPTKLRVYIYQYTIKGDELYADIAIAGSMTDYNSGVTYIYKDFFALPENSTDIPTAGDNVYTTLGADNNIFQLNRQNYTDFANYRFTFKRNSDSSYFFSNLERKNNPEN